MGYGARALSLLGDWIGDILPTNGHIVELGSQDINADVPLSLIEAVSAKIHGRSQVVERPQKVAELFRNSGYEYTAIDLYGGDRVLVVDLNTWRVPADLEGTVDVVTNHGTTEHVADQINVFRVIHDLLKVGGHAYHVSPVTGFFNHGLYNYHPVFFLMLAHANHYRIGEFELWEPFLPHTIPVLDWLRGTQHWSKVRIESGVASVLMQKTQDASFKLFTDYDRAAMPGEDELEAMLRDRYDLRIRS